MAQFTNDEPGTIDDDDPTTRGPQLSRLWLKGDPEPWARAGFEVGSGGVIRVGNTSLIPAGSDGQGVRWAFEPGPSTETIDGIAVVHDSNGAETSDGEGGHRNGIVSIDHVVIVTDDCARTVSSFEGVGFPARRTIITERFGTPLLQTFLWAGDVMLEVIGPPEPIPSEGPALGAGLFGITFVTSDMALTVDTLGSAIGTPRPAVQPNRTITTLRTKELGIRTRVAVMTEHVPGSPRYEE